MVSNDDALDAEGLTTRQTLTRLDAAHPGLARYFASIGAAIGVSESFVLDGMERGLDALGEAAAAAACRTWEGLGILPEADIKTDAQVGAIWTSPLFEIFLEAIKFYPPRNTKLVSLRRTPLQSHDEAPALDIPSIQGSSYWEHVYHSTFPELYLFPFLATGGSILTGCDVGCGWGRATLGLRRFELLHVHCCDLSRQSLQLIRDLAFENELSAHVTTRECNILSLPYRPETFDFFLAFDILEHVTDEALDRVLDEILRCAKPGGVLYAEIPLHAYCPAGTHLQDFSWARVSKIFGRHAHAGRRFKPLVWDERIPSHFAFRIV